MTHFFSLLIIFHKLYILYCDGWLQPFPFVTPFRIHICLGERRKQVPGIRNYFLIEVLHEIRIDIMQAIFPPQLAVLNSWIFCFVLAEESVCHALPLNFTDNQHPALWVLTTHTSPIRSPFTRWNAYRQNTKGRQTATSRVNVKVSRRFTLLSKKHKKERNGKKRNTAVK